MTAAEYAALREELAPMSVMPVASFALDWSGRGGAVAAGVGDPLPCRHCRRPAILREPGSGRACHKVCAEADLAKRGAELAGRAA